jgi:sugar lactone lactonase YvrE
MGVVALVVASGATSATAAPTARTATVTTIASGFDNPRSIVAGRDGRLYVAEAGRGGPKCVAGGEEGNLCVGLTGGISVLGAIPGGHHRILDGLASISDEGGVAATGPDGLAINADGSLFTVITSCPQQVADLPVGVFGADLVHTVQSQVGQVIKQLPGGYQTKGNVGQFDWDWSLDHTHLVPGQFPDCNPYGIHSEGREHWVVDAATNTLDHVRADGHVSIVSFFPNPQTSDSVPTCIDRGPDGAFYVGELTGGGNGPGAARIWRVDPRPGHTKPTLWASGLTAVTGCGFVNGTFYATEFSTLGFESFQPGTGAVVRVPANSTEPVTVVDGLSFPQGLAAMGNSLFVSNWSIAPGQVPPGAGFQPGSVVRIDL